MTMVSPGRAISPEEGLPDGTDERADAFRGVFVVSSFLRVTFLDVLALAVALLEAVLLPVVFLAVAFLGLALLAVVLFVGTLRLLPQWIPQTTSST
jgi:hypothetical protein